MPRVVWKGAITFGLVHVPVALYPGSRSEDLDFDMLDRRDMGPVGYQRINKQTGKPVPWADIVKGYEIEDDRYVVVTDEDFRLANPKATQTVDILAFVDAGRIPPYFYDTPYYLEPAKRAEKGYALLREVLAGSGKIGIANVVIRTRQHLAALIPIDRLLVLNTLRFAGEILPAKDLALPGRELGRVGVSARELEMAQRLVDDMSEGWDPRRYRDTYRDDLLARIEQKVRAKQTHVVTEPAESEKPAKGADIIDLTAMLRRSLERRGEARAEESGVERGGGRRQAVGSGRRKAGRAPAGKNTRKVAAARATKSSRAAVAAPGKRRSSGGERARSGR